MARAEEHREGREDGSSRVLSNTGSFRSAISYASFKEGQATSYPSFNASFRSCNSFKSTDGFSRTSFKSVASRGSRGTSYHSAVSRFLGRSVSDGGPAAGETSLEGVDNLSFFSFEGGGEDGQLGSLPSEAQRRLSAGSTRGAGEVGNQQQGKGKRD